MASPRMIALLGLLAVAGYQNRDKLGAMLGGLRGNTAPRDSNAPATATSNEGGGFFDNIGDSLSNLFGGNSTNSTNPNARTGGGIGDFLGNLFGGGSAADGIGGGLRDLIDRFTGNGHAEEAKSWVEVGPNRGISEPALAEALGEDTITELMLKTGLSRPELLARLKTVLPEAVDTMTPDGRVPPASATGQAA